MAEEVKDLNIDSGDKPLPKEAPEYKGVSPIDGRKLTPNEFKQALKSLGYEPSVLKAKVHSLERHLNPYAESQFGRKYDYRKDLIEYKQSGLKDFSSALYNELVVGLGEGLSNLIPTVSQALTPNELEWANTWTNSVSDWFKQQEAYMSDDFYKPIDSFSDINTSHFWGALGQGLGFIGGMVGGGSLVKGASKISKIANTTSKLNRAKRIGSFMTGTTMMYPAIYEEAKANGISSTHAARLALGIAGVVSLTEGAALEWIGKGITSPVTKKATQQSLKEALKDVGKITSIDDVLLAQGKTVKGLLNKLKAVMPKVIESSSIEFGQEFSQTYIEEGMKQMYDSIYASDKEVGKGKFGADVTNYETFVQSVWGGIIGGILGGGMGSVSVFGNVEQETTFGYINRNIRKGNLDIDKRLISSLDSMRSKDIISEDEHVNSVKNVKELTEFSKNIKGLAVNDGVANYQLYQIDKVQGNIRSLMDNIKYSENAPEITKELYDSKKEQLGKIYSHLKLKALSIYASKEAFGSNKQEFESKLKDYENLAKQVISGNISESQLDKKLEEKIDLPKAKTYTDKSGKKLNANAIRNYNPKIKSALDVIYDEKAPKEAKEKAQEFMDDHISLKDNDMSVDDYKYLYDNYSRIKTKYNRKKLDLYEDVSEKTKERKISDKVFKTGKETKITETALKDVETVEALGKELQQEKTTPERKSEIETELKDNYGISTEDAIRLAKDKTNILDAYDEGKLQEIETEKEKDSEKKEDKPKSESTEKEETLTEEVYQKFIDEGVVPESVLTNIAQKVKNKEDLTKEEEAIFTDKTSEVNDIIAKQEETKSQQEPESSEATQEQDKVKEPIQTKQEEETPTGIDTTKLEEGVEESFDFEEDEDIEETSQQTEEELFKKLNDKSKQIKIDIFDKGLDQRSKRLAKENSSLHSELALSNPELFNSIAEIFSKIFPKISVQQSKDLGKKFGADVLGTTTSEGIFINPDKALQNTLIHEYAHIYLNALGYDSAIVKKGLEFIEDTEFYKEAKELYPDLDKQGQLIEALTEAISQSSFDILNTKFQGTTLDKFIAWAKRFWAKVKSYITGKESDVVDLLAQSMTLRKSPIDITADGINILHQRKVSYEKKVISGLTQLSYVQHKIEQIKSEQVGESYINIQDANVATKAIYFDFHQRYLQEQNESFPEDRKIFNNYGIELNENLKEDAALNNFIDEVTSKVPEISNTVSTAIEQLTRKSIDKEVLDDISFYTQQQEDFENGEGKFSQSDVVAKKGISPSVRSILTSLIDYNGNRLSIDKVMQYITDVTANVFGYEQFKEKIKTDAKNAENIVSKRLNEIFTHYTNEPDVLNSFLSELSSTIAIPYYKQYVDKKGKRVRRVINDMYDLKIEDVLNNVRKAKENFPVSNKLRGLSKKWKSLKEDVTDKDYKDIQAVFSYLYGDSYSLDNIKSIDKSKLSSMVYGFGLLIDSELNPEDISKQKSTIRSFIDNNSTSQYLSNMFVNSEGSMVSSVRMGYWITEAHKRIKHLKGYAEKLRQSPIYKNNGVLIRMMKSKKINWGIFDALDENGSVRTYGDLKANELIGIDFFDFISGKKTSYFQRVGVTGDRTHMTKVEVPKYSFDDLKGVNGKVGVKKFYIDGITNQYNESSNKEKFVKNIKDSTLLDFVDGKFVFNDEFVKQEVQYIKENNIITDDILKEVESKNLSVDKALELFVINESINRNWLEDIYLSPPAERKNIPDVTKRNSMINSGMSKLEIEEDKPVFHIVIKANSKSLTDSKGKSIATSDSFSLMGNGLWNKVNQLQGSLNKAGANIKDQLAQVSPQGKLEYLKMSSIGLTSKDANHNLAQMSSDENAYYKRLGDALIKLENKLGDGSYVRIIDENTIKGDNSFGEVQDIDQFLSEVEAGNLDDVMSKGRNVNYYNYGTAFNVNKDLSTVKLMDQNVVLSTQLSKIVLNGKELQEVEEFENNIVSLLKQSLEIKPGETYTDSKVYKDIIDNNEFFKGLLDNSEDSNQGYVTQLISLMRDYSNTVPENRKFTFDHPNLKPIIESFIASKFKKKGVRLEISGNNLHMLPNFGEDLRFYEFDENGNPLKDKNGDVRLAEIAVPWSMYGESLESANIKLNEYKNLKAKDSRTQTEELVYQDLKLMFSVVAVRVPASGPMSTFAAEVKYFTDGKSNTVIAPDGFIKASDADHDVDKLFVYRPELKNDGNLRKSKAGNHSQKTQLFKKLLDFSTTDSMVKGTTTTLELDLLQRIGAKLLEGSQDQRRGKARSVVDISKTSQEMSLGAHAIGRFAVASKTMSMLSQSNEGLVEPFDIEIDGKNFRIDRFTTKQLNELAVALQGALDMGKDPVLNDLGITKDNIDLVNTMLLFGVDLESIGKVINSKLTGLEKDINLLKPIIDTTASWSNLKNQPVYTEQGVNTMRTSNKEAEYAHFDNPYSASGYAGTIKMPTVEVAVQAYKDWLLGDNIQHFTTNNKAEKIRKEGYKVNQPSIFTISTSQETTQGIRKSFMPDVLYFTKDSTRWAKAKNIFVGEGKGNEDFTYYDYKGQGGWTTLKNAAKSIKLDKVDFILKSNANILKIDSINSIENISEKVRNYFKNKFNKDEFNFINDFIPYMKTIYGEDFFTDSSIVMIAQYAKENNFDGINIVDTGKWKKEKTDKYGNENLYDSYTGNSGKNDFFIFNQNILLQNPKPQQRQWILEQINSGKLDNATLLYDGKLAGRGQGTHAHALAEVVQELREKRKYETDEGVRGLLTSNKDYVINKFKPIQKDIRSLVSIIQLDGNIPQNSDVLDSVRSTFDKMYSDKMTFTTDKFRNRPLIKHYKSVLGLQKSSLEDKFFSESKEMFKFYKDLKTVIPGIKKNQFDAALYHIISQELLSDVHRNMNGLEVDNMLQNTVEEVEVILKGNKVLLDKFKARTDVHDKSTDKVINVANKVISGGNIDAEIDAVLKLKDKVSFKEDVEKYIHLKTSDNVSDLSDNLFLQHLNIFQDKDSDKKTFTISPAYLSAQPSIQNDTRDSFNQLPQELKKKITIYQIFTGGVQQKKNSISEMIPFSLQEAYMDKLLEVKGKYLKDTDGYDTLLKRNIVIYFQDRITDNEKSYIYKPKGSDKVRLRNNFGNDLVINNGQFYNGGYFVKFGNKLNKVTLSEDTKQTKDIVERLKKDCK